jgi:hypothetical protein
MANIVVTITSGCCNPNPVLVNDGDTITWTAGDSRSYMVTPPPGVFSTNAAIKVPVGGSATSSPVTGTPSAVPKTYRVAPPCTDKVPPDIIIDGGTDPEENDREEGRY